MKHMIGVSCSFFYKGAFSQWEPSDFEVDGVKYCTAEQYMMAGKAHLFGDTEILEKIMVATKPWDHKKLGRDVRNEKKEKWTAEDIARWNTVARDVVYKGNHAKFTQNADMWGQLHSTDDRYLVEASPTDKLWGIGLDLHHPDILHPTKWQGTNWLGEVLTLVKNDIRAGICRTEGFKWIN